MGDYVGIAPTRKRVSFNPTDTVKIRDGLLSEHWGAARLCGFEYQLRT